VTRLMPSVRLSDRRPRCTEDWLSVDSLSVDLTQDHRNCSVSYMTDVYSDMLDWFLHMTAVSTVRSSTISGSSS